LLDSFFSQQKNPGGAEIRTRKVLAWFYRNVRIRIPYNVAQEYTNSYYDFTNVVVATHVSCYRDSIEMLE
jgi:hypothetical protein